MLPSSLATMVAYHLNGDVLTFIADPAVGLVSREFRLAVPGENYDNAVWAPLGSYAGRIAEGGLILYKVT